jgi:translation initiation factor IF-2
MTKRLNKVTVEFNVGLSTIVEFLHKKGFEIPEDPNAKIPEEAYDLLLKEYSPDQNLRRQTDQFKQQRQNKDRNATVSIVGFGKTEKKEQPKENTMIRTEIPTEARPHFTSVGKIDLDNPGRGIQKDHEEEKPVEEKPAEPVAAPAEKPVEKPARGRAETREARSACSRRESRRGEGRKASRCAGREGSRHTRSSCRSRCRAEARRYRERTEACRGREETFCRCSFSAGCGREEARRAEGAAARSR